MAPAGRRGVARGSDAAIAVALGLVAFATRWSLRGHALFSWDSGLLASGVVEYDFAAGHPHPPYYPLAIALAKAVAPWTGPIAAVTFTAVLGAAVMAAFTFLAARAFLGRPASAFAAALVVLSPTALFNGIAPLTYSLEGASSAVLGWAAWRCRASPTPGRAAILAVATSVALGIRPSSLFLLAPLALWAVWGRWRALAWALGTGAVATLAWGVPALVAGGGWGWFLRATQYQSRTIVFAHTVFDDGLAVVPRFAARLASYVPAELPFLFLLLALLVATGFVWWPHRPRRPVAGFLAAWAVPSLAFYLLVYDGWPVYPSGYVLALLPPAAVAAATAADTILRGFARSGAPAPARTIAIAGCLGLLVAPAGWAASWDEAASGQREADAYAASLPSLREAYPANETAILTYYGWFWVRFGLPEYLAWGAQPYIDDEGIRVQVAEGRHGREHPPAYANSLDGADDPLHPIPPWVERVVVVMGPPTRGFQDPFKPGLPTEDVTLPSGLRVLVLDARAADLPSIEHALRWFDDQGRPLVEAPSA
jgi:hypothetical protein